LIIKSGQGRGPLFLAEAIVWIERIERAEKRITNHVQNTSRSHSAQARYTAGSIVIGRPLSLVSVQTAALGPLVLQNESHVWSERKNTRLVSEKLLESSKNATKQFTQFRIAGNQPHGTQNWGPESFQSFSRRREKQGPGAES
jgi:hypothetical protein